MHFFFLQFQSYEIKTIIDNNYMINEQNILKNKNYYYYYFFFHLFILGYDDNCISPEAADLVKKLLEPNYKIRLGANGG